MTPKAFLRSWRQTKTLRTKFPERHPWDLSTHCPWPAWYSTHYIPVQCSLTTRTLAQLSPNRGSSGLSCSTCHHVHTSNTWCWLWRWAKCKICEAILTFIQISKDVSDSLWDQAKTRHRNRATTESSLGWCLVESWKQGCLQDPRTIQLTEYNSSQVEL